MEEMDLLGRLILKMNGTGIDNINHRMLTYIIQHADEVVHMSIYELADACFVSPSTVSRLPAQLGCRNFNDFKVELGTTLRIRQVQRGKTSSANPPYPFGDTLAGELTLFLHQMEVDKLEAAVDAIRAASQVGVFAPATLQAHAFQRTLCDDRIPAVNVVDFADQIAYSQTLRAGDCVVLLLNTAEQFKMKQEMMEQLCERGIRLIAICSDQCRIPEHAAQFRIVYSGADQNRAGLYLELALLMLHDLYRERRNEQ